MSKKQGGTTKPNNTTTVGRTRNFDFRWLAIILFLGGALAAAFYLNTEHIVDYSAQIIEGLDIDDSDLKINWSKYPTVDIQLTDPLTITQSGTYHITGFLYDGGITIDAGIGEVKLILDNTIIDNPTGPAINCWSAEDLVIELVGNNNLSDGETYSADYDPDVTGVIYSKADLAFYGDGSLAITSSYQDAIVGKDDLKFDSGRYKITAKDDAIRGKDSVYIVSGDFTIEAGADAIKSTNDLNRNKGFVLIESGTLSLSTTVGKGIKATNYLIVNGGTHTINSYDDAIHSDNYVNITNGVINISSGDDGVHANNKIIIDGGNLTISKAYEGVEAQAITVNGGNISVTSSDDGINAGGGADGSANNRKGSSPFDVDTDCIIAINGGNIYINSAGDGIDSNGYLYFNGGNTIVNGPTNNGNGSLDATGGITTSGGSVIAIGSSGMVEPLGSQSLAYNINVYLDTIKPAGTNIKIADTSGNLILSHISAKSFSHILAATGGFKLGGTYTIYLDGEEYQTFTITEVTTTIGRGQPNRPMPVSPGN